MEIKVYWAWHAPEKITGPAVVIDAYAATANIITFLSKGARLFLVDHGTLKPAMKSYPEAVIAGESEGQGPVRFDLPNLPHVIAESDLTGKTVLYMSINGTQAVGSALTKGAESVIACAFTNVSAVAAFLKKTNRQVTVLLSGDDQNEVTEDMFCADVLDAEIHGMPYRWDAMKTEISRFAEEYYGVPGGNENISAILEKDRYRIVPVCRLTPQGYVSVTDIQA